MGATIAKTDAMKWHKVCHFNDLTANGKHPFFKKCFNGKRERNGLFLQ